MKPSLNILICGIDNQTRLNICLNQALNHDLRNQKLYCRDCQKLQKETLPVIILSMYKARI